MSNALQTSALLTAINAAIQTAAQTFLSTSAPNPILIFNEQPRTEVETLPYAIAEPEVVHIDMAGRAGTVAGISQENRFRIIVRQRFPTDPSQLLLNLKLAAANALIANLQNGPGFAGIAMLPLVSDVTFAETDSFSTKVFEVELAFTCVTIGTHH